MGCISNNALYWRIRLLLREKDKGIQGLTLQKATVCTRSGTGKIRSSNYYPIAILRDVGRRY